jgi:hypothetical protein
LEPAQIIPFIPHVEKGKTGNPGKGPYGLKNGVIQPILRNDVTRPASKPEVLKGPY